MRSTFNQFDLSFIRNLLIIFFISILRSSEFIIGDVIRARNGKTTEITNTDAEGRLGTQIIYLNAHHIVLKLISP
jgi:Cytosol aminopeptidase family, catalytic domain